MGRRLAESEAAPQRVERDSWWSVIAFGLMAIGVYLLLAAHLLLAAIHASALVWAAGFTVPLAFFIGAGLALGAGSGWRLSEQGAALPALLLGSPSSVGRREKIPASPQASAPR
jgi:hypothetical protein